MTQKSYNMQALRGHDYTDQEFQADMAEAGVNIPDELLYKPALNDFVLQEMYDKNVQGLQQVVNQDTGKNYTHDEAIKYAKELRSKSSNIISELMSIK